MTAILVFYAIEKADNGRWGELLYGCHIASTLIAIGIFARARKLVAIGLVFHLAVGIPSWLTWAATNGTRPMEIAGHVVPVCAALPVILREGWPAPVAPWAFGMFVVAQQAALWLTDPALNVNVAHAPTPPMEWLITTPLMARLTVCAMALATLSIAEVALGRVLKKEAIA